MPHTQARDLARALAAVANALTHVPVTSLQVNADERAVLLTIPAESGDQTGRLLLLAQLAQALGLPEPRPSRVAEEFGARVQTADTPRYAPGITVTLWTPLTAPLLAEVGK